MKTTVVPILIGRSDAKVIRVLRDDGVTWIEKHGTAEDLYKEARIMEWCAGRLPVPTVLEKGHGFLRISELRGKHLAEVPIELAVRIIAQALELVHSVPIQDCPFLATWTRRLAEGEARARSGLVDESDFDDNNRGRSIAEILCELQSFPPLPDVTCFTHGDACLPNFLADGGHLSGIVDVGRAGIAHPAQDWALALRSVRDNFGVQAEQLLWKSVPSHCADEELLRRFRLLDELF